jgi:cell filamentation protein
MMVVSKIDQIIEKYVEMNISNPFRGVNGRATRICLDFTLKKDIKYLLKQALTNEIGDRSLFMKGINVSYYYEGYSKFRTEDV